jgi:hypothetical protein
MLTLHPNEFTHPDYTVTFRANDGRRLSVGRIFLANAGVPKETPWVWAVEFHQRKGRSAPHHGNALNLEAAKAAWKQCWESADAPINWPPSLVATYT